MNRDYFKNKRKQQQQKQGRVLSLKECCVEALRERPGLLGNVAGAPLDLIKPVLATLRAADLARVEDQTSSQGFLDITPDTWRYWKALCEKDMGQIDTSKVPPLNLTPACDAPPDLPAEAGDYRTYYCQRMVELAEKRDRIAVRARAAMERERELKEARKIQVTDLTGPKKRRTSILETSKGAPRKMKGNLLAELGLVRKIRKKSSYSAEALGKVTPPDASVMDHPQRQSSGGRWIQPGRLSGLRSLAGTLITSPRTPTTPTTPGRRTPSHPPHPRSTTSLAAPGRLGNPSPPLNPGMLMRMDHDAMPGRLSHIITTPANRNPVSNPANTSAPRVNTCTLRSTAPHAGRRTSPHLPHPRSTTSPGAPRRLDNANGALNPARQMRTDHHATLARPRSTTSPAPPSRCPNPNTPLNAAMRTDHHVTPGRLPRIHTTPANRNYARNLADPSVPGVETPTLRAPVPHTVPPRAQARGLAHRPRSGLKRTLEALSSTPAPDPPQKLSRFEMWGRK